MFPGSHASVYYNEAGEVLGWDYPCEPEYDPDAYLAWDDDEDDEDVERCEADARRGTGTGVCDRPLDSYGRCDRASDHV